MDKGLIDIRNKAREKSLKFGKFSPYEISCETLIAILNELEVAQQNIDATASPCGICGAGRVSINVCPNCDQ